MNEYRDIHASFLRLAKDFADDKGIVVVNLDAVADPEEWPQEDFVGVGEVRIEVDDHKIRAYAAFAISTFEDKNLMRLTSYVSDLFDQLVPSSWIRIYDASTGGIRGKLVVQNGTKVDAVVETDTQPIQPILVTMLSDQTLRI